MKRMVLMISVVLMALRMYSLDFNSGVRIHCEGDTAKLGELFTLMRAGGNQGRVAASILVADALMGTPYVANTLEGTPEQLTIRLDALDCVTYVDNVIALTKAAEAPLPSWRNFAEALENVRYRKGEMKGYPSRLHYISDWVSENIYRGNVKEITEDLPGSTFTRMTLDYMTRNPEQYPALQDPEVLDEIRMVEMGLRVYRVPYLRKESIGKKEITSELRDGDILVVVPNITGLDASHVGFIRMKDGVAYLQHASSKEGKVVLETQPLTYYFTHQGRKSKGFRILRIAE